MLKHQLSWGIVLLQAPPNLVTEEQRHVAEQVFIALEKSAISIETCRQILGKRKYRKLI